MLFTEGRFFLFYLVVFALYWALRSNAWRKNWLLVVSYLFYGLWDWRFLVLLGGSSLFNYWIGIRLGDVEADATRKRIALFSAAANLALLAYFKYLNFFIDSVERIAGAGAHGPMLHIILPVGISFFTFHSLSYTIDVYRRDYPPCRSLRDYLLFVAFFPQLVAGPIMRPTWLLPQFSSLRRFPWNHVRYLLAIFALGFFKKAVVADNIAPFVDQIFSNPAAYSPTATFIGVGLYAVQIYCDFSGYTDMALAVAGLLGYRLIRNFNMPYLATSIQEFWRRWHISLSSWLRDYLYIALGGSRHGEAKTHRNLIATMLLGGLWHGAAWTFVVWGGLHGVAQSIQRLWGRHVGRHYRGRFGPAGPLLGWALTLYFVCGCWILFRAPSFATGLAVMRKYLFLDHGGEQTLPLALGAVLPALILAEWLYARRLIGASRAAEPKVPVLIFCLGYGAAWALMLAFLPLANRPFIYFQF